MNKIRNLTSNVYFLIFILIFTSISARFLYFQDRYSNEKYDFIEDQFLYHKLAESLAIDDEFSYTYSVSSEDGIANEIKHTAYSFRSPFLPLLTAGVYKIFGVEEYYARLFMIFVSSITVLLLYFFLALRIEASKKVSFISSFAFALYPPSIYYASELLTENIATPLIIIILSMFYKNIKRGQKLSSFFFIGIMFSILSLSRSSLTLLPFFLILLNLILSLLFKKTIPEKNILSSRSLFVLMLGFILGLSPWTIRNYDIHKSFIPTTTQTGMVLYITNGNLDSPDIQNGGYYKNRPVIEKINRIEGELERDKIAKKLAVDEIKKNYNQLFIPIMNRAKNFITFRPNPYKSSYTSNDLVMFVIWIPILTLFCLSLFYDGINEDWLMLSFVLYIFLITLLFWGIPRFRYPVDFIFIYKAVSFLLDRFKYLKY
jgi:4-amino-4-deoxy-L-arabinose transferase-like glycosyltransferase